MHSQLELVDGNVGLTFSYPLEASIVSIAHDPSVGLDTDHAVARTWSLTTLSPFNPMVYVVAATVGVCIVVAARHANRIRKRGSTDELDDEP